MESGGSTSLLPSSNSVANRHLDALRNLKPGDDLLSHGETPHYHRRCIVSLLSSGWDQVGPILYGRQTKLVETMKVDSVY